MTKCLLWDIDNTLLDFLAAEKVAIRACAKSHEMGEFTDEMIARYSVINRKYWEKLERNEITKPEVLVGRFKEFFESEGLDVTKAESFNDEYQIRLGDICVFMDYGYALVKYLKEAGYKQFCVTNGTKIAQERKLKNSGLGELFDGAFISDEIGVEKPMDGFFVPVEAKLNELGITKDECVIIGDSLTSDMKGGENFGITNIWYNPRHEENKSDVRIDFEIDNLWKILNIVCDIKVRPATVEDGERLLNIYSHYVEDTAVSFEYDVPSLEEFTGRIKNISAKYPYIVAERDGQIVGYAYAGSFKGRAAYDWSVETTIYLDNNVKRGGIGRHLYAILECMLHNMGICNMNACIAVPAGEDEHLTMDSVYFHERMGFDLVGTFHKSGFKYNTWYDMCWMEKMIGEHTFCNPPIRLPEYF